MDHDLQTFFGPASQHRLSVSEKEDIYRQLQGRLPSSVPAESAYGGSFFWRGLRSIFSSWTPVAAVVIVLVLAGAGITSAESALPGDFLYPLKRMNERISKSVRFSTEARVAVEAEHMQKRLDEATALEAKGRLNETSTVELDQEYRLERREAVKHIEQLEAAGKQEVVAAMRARLNAAEDRYERLFKGKRRQQPKQDERSGLRDARQFPTVKEEAPPSSP